MAYETEHPLINGASNDSVANANLIANRVTTLGNLSSSTDVDYFRIDVSGPSLVQIQFSNSLVTSTNHWSLALLDGEGDYLQTLTRSVSGDVTVDGNSQSGKVLNVTGVTSSTVPSNSRFTIDVANQADTTIYTVVNNATPASGQAELTLSTSVSSPADGATLVFDPAQTLADGGQTSLTALAPSAGGYYVKVNAQNYSSADYALTAKVISLLESTSTNDSIADAVLANNRLVANAWMQGALSGATDKDVWLLTTASAADFYLDFAAASGDNNAPQWNVSIAEWDGVRTIPVTVNGVAVSGAAGAAKTFQPNTSLPTVDPTSPATYVVTVEKLESASLNTGTYTLRARGTALDANDAPVLVVDKVSSGRPNIQINTGVERSLTQGPDSRVALSSLFGISDADESASDLSWASYKVSLQAASGSAANGFIQIEPTSGAASAYVDGSLLSAADMANAWVYAGTQLGTMSLTIQAFDSTGAPDDSGASSFMTQTLKITADEVGLTVETDVQTLVEGAASGAVGASATISLSLKSAPTSDVKVYLEQDSPSELQLSKTVLTFTPDNYAQIQTVAVKAVSDGVIEGNHTGVASLRLVSSDSNYDGLAVEDLTFALSDPAVVATGYTVQGVVRHWMKANVALSDVALAVGDQGTQSGGDGSFLLSEVADDDGVITLSPTLAPPASVDAAAVTLTDVLAALKVYLNKPLPDAYDSPYKYIAADFDANGVVNLTDVLQLLKYYLRKPTTGDVAPSWAFVDASDQTGSGLGTSIADQHGGEVSRASALPHAIDHDFSGASAVELIGVLRGDVDGSWAA